MENQVLNPMTPVLVACSVVAFAYLTVCFMKIFTKAGHAGWKAFVPALHFVPLTKIAGLPTWYAALYFIPVVSIYAIYKTADGLSTNFGKDFKFTVGLFICPPVFLTILAFGPAHFRGPHAHLEHKHAA